MIVSNPTKTTMISESNELTPHLLEPYELWVKIFSYMNAKDLGRCSSVSREWKIVADDETLWKQIVRSQVLGKKVWEKAAAIDVGIEPEYRMVPFNGMDGDEISWKEVCKMHKNPSSSLVNNRMSVMPEFDFLVPATINGQPTTIRNVIEAFANARLPFGYYIDLAILEQYGDVPVKRSYFARQTWTVVNDTRDKHPNVRVAQIHEKGKGLYRMHRVIEMMIFQFLCYKAGIKSGYSQNPPTWSQCLEPLKINGKRYPIYTGACQIPTTVSPIRLDFSCDAGVDMLNGAGGLREL